LAQTADEEYEFRKVILRRPIRRWISFSNFVSKCYCCSAN